MLPKAPKLTLAGGWASGSVQLLISTLVFLVAHIGRLLFAAAPSFPTEAAECASSIGLVPHKPELRLPKKTQDWDHIGTIYLHEHGQGTEVRVYQCDSEWVYKKQESRGELVFREWPYRFTIHAFYFGASGKWEHQQLIWSFQPLVRFRQINPEKAELVTHIPQRIIFANSSVDVCLTFNADGDIILPDPPKVNPTPIAQPHSAPEVQEKLVIEYLSMKHGRLVLE